MNTNTNKISIPLNESILNLFETKQNDKILELINKYGFEIMKNSNSDSNNPLHLACYYDNIELVESLIKSNVNINDVNKYKKHVS